MPSEREQTVLNEDGHGTVKVDFIDKCLVTVKLWPDGTLDVDVRAGEAGEIVAAWTTNVPTEDQAASASVETP